jgi:geranylgeranylglycerol-phosphate geranylgeranyltransferase
MAVVLRTDSAAALRLIGTGRPGVALSAGTLAAAAAWFGQVSRPLQALLTGLVVMLVTMMSMTFNDLFDLSKDRRAGVDRALAAGRVSPSAAAWYASSLAVAALLLASASSPPWGLLFFSIAAGLGYSPFARLLPRAKTIYAAACCALPLWYGAATANARVGWVPIVAVIVFNLGREVFLDAHDATGDAKSGLRTFAVAIGPDLAHRVGAFAMLAVVTVFAIWEANGARQLGATVAAALVGVAAFARNVDARAARGWTRAAMVVGALVAASYVA